jgi:hypothetical protein
MRRGFISESGADARQERGGNLGVGRDVKAGIDRREESMFLGKGNPASGASGEVRAQFALWLEAGVDGFD